MKKIENQRQYIELIEEINEHDRHYYDEAKPLISDYEYDKMMQALIDYEKKHPNQVLADSPSIRISESPTKGFEQKKHLVPMMSLNNTYSKEELEAFVKRVLKLLEKKEVEFCVELKMDGTSISLTYEKGIFTRAVTRGNGKVGDDVTQNIKTIRSIPLKIKSSLVPDVLEIRAEIYMSLASFQEINEAREESGLDLFANPRNAAAGSLKLLDSKEVAKRKLHCLTYGIASKSLPESIKTQDEVHAYLKKIGLPVASSEHLAVCTSAEQILAFAEKIDRKRKKLPFEIDGIVVKVNSLKDHERLGSTGKAPRFAVAYKFAPEQTLTRILDITVQVGRTGVLTPVAELEPALVSGSTISRASLHNQEEIARKDIRIGDFVVIEKAGDVIPQVVRVEFSKRPSSLKVWHMPDKCPVCKSKVVHKKGEVAIRCPNLKCGAQKVRSIIYFASKGAMDIEHMGEKVVMQLVKKGLISRISDIYLLDEIALRELEGFKEKSIQNLLESIEESKKCPLPRFIMALGIPYVGAETAEILAQEAGDISKLMEFDLEKLTAIDGIGEKTAQAIYDYFQDVENLEEIHLLLSHGVEPKKIKKIAHHEFSGKTFVLTGSLENYSRDEASALIKERGGKVSSSVSKKTDYLLLGEEPGSKYEKAKKLGVKIITEKQFENKI